MKKIKVIIQIFFLITLLTGCQSAKDVLTGKKANSQGEEFLVEKKNPLVVPPDFDELPIPKQENNVNEENAANENDFQKLLEKESNTGSNSANNSSNSTEESILKKIKNKQ